MKSKILTHELFPEELRMLLTELKSCWDITLKKSASRFREGQLKGKLKKKCRTCPIKKKKALAYLSRRERRENINILCLDTEKSGKRRPFKAKG